jgi:hypothetical protein
MSMQGLLTWKRRSERPAMAETIRFILSIVPALSFVLAIAIAVSRRDGQTLALPRPRASDRGDIDRLGGQPVPIRDRCRRHRHWPSRHRLVPVRPRVQERSRRLYRPVRHWLAIGHVRQAVIHGDYTANNFGLLLGLTVIQAVLLPLLLWLATREGTDPTRAASGQRITSCL